MFLIWPWGISNGSNLGWMNIHLPSILMFTTGTIGFDPHICLFLSHGQAPKGVCFFWFSRVFQGFFWSHDGQAPKRLFLVQGMAIGSPFRFSASGDIRCGRGARACGTAGRAPARLRTTAAWYWVLGMDRFGMPMMPEKGNPPVERFIQRAGLQEVLQENS